jgi:hypothetical protein
MARRCAPPSAVGEIDLSAQQRLLQSLQEHLLVLK